MDCSSGAPQSIGGSQLAGNFSLLLINAITYDVVQGRVMDAESRKTVVVLDRQAAWSAMMERS